MGVSRLTRLMLWRGQPNPWTLTQLKTCGVTSNMLKKNAEELRNAVQSGFELPNIPFSSIFYKGLKQI